MARQTRSSTSRASASRASASRASAPRAAPASTGGYAPGTTVLVRAKGYPAWPAEIVEDEDVPEAVLAAKPRKKAVFPVLFYNDFSFLWLTQQDCKPLSRDEALKASKAPRVGKQVKDAYIVAADPPDYKKYVAQATHTDEPEAEPKAEPEEEREPSRSDKSKGRKTRGRAKPAAERAPPKPAVKVSVNIRKRSAEPELSSKKKKTKVEEPEVLEAAEISEEAGDDEYVENSPDESDYSEGIATDDLATSQDARYNLCAQVRQIAQECLLENGDKADLAKLSNALKLIEDAPELEISVVRRSKLSRVLATALVFGKVPSDVLDRVEELNSRWNTPAEPVIRGIPEDLAPKEETVEPEDLISKEPTEEPSDFDLLSARNGHNEPTSQATSELASEIPSDGSSEVSAKAPSEALSETPAPNGNADDKASILEPNGAAHAPVLEAGTDATSADANAV